jgi:hypothetical protein
MAHQSSNSSPDSSIFRPWRNQATELSRYWSLHGGWAALCRSPYVQLSIAIGLITQVCPSSTFDAAATAISILPNVLGFTVGALAIILAFASSDFFKYLAEDGREKSVFMQTVANFVHFVLVQVFCLILSVICESHPNWLLKIATAIMLIYALFTTLSTVIQLFQMATVFNAAQRPELHDGQ